MKKKISIITVIILVFLTGCSIPSSDIISRDIGKNTTKIMIAISYNENPDGRNEAKIIVDKDEIVKIVNSFRYANVNEETDNLYGNVSVFRFYKEDELLLSLPFSVDRTHVLYRNNKCYQVAFKSDSPWTLYTESAADVCYVNKDFHVIP